MEQHKDRELYIEIANYRLKTAEEDAELLIGTAEELIVLIKRYIEKRSDRKTPEG